ncbi:hypothetical protein L6Q79_04190 [bacterium]|nr:hypothetical protein [bacterium]NUN44260.1 hypothetical protein [bacterium]
MKKTMFLLLLILGVVHITHAQMDWMNPTTRGKFSIDFYHPDFDSKGYNAITGLYDITFQTTLASGSAVRIEVPFCNFSYERNGFKEDEFALSNIYLGFRMNNNDEWFTDIGLRLPTASDDKFLANLIGGSADYERMYAYGADVITGSIMVQRHKIMDKGSYMGFRLGTSVSHFTDSEVEDPTDLWANYGVYCGLDLEKFGASMGYEGVVIFTEDGNISDRHLSTVEVSAYLKHDRIRPGLFLKIPMDEEISNGMGKVIGLSISMSY